MNVFDNLLRYLCINVGTSYLAIGAPHTAAWFLSAASRMGDAKATYLLGISIVAGNHRGYFSFDDGITMIREASNAGFERAQLWLVRYSSLITDSQKKDNFSIRCDLTQVTKGKGANAYLTRNLQYVVYTTIFAFTTYICVTGFFQVLLNVISRL